MNKYEFNKEQIEAVMTEVERRVQIDVNDALSDGCDVSVKEIREYRANMMQGVYGTLMVLSKNWPDVVTMLDQIEEDLHWNDLGYSEDTPTESVG